MSLSLPVAGGTFLKASEDLSENPREFIVYKEPVYGPANNPKYGDAEGNTYTYFLKEGATEYILNSTSKRLAQEWNKANLDLNDKVLISKTGSGMDTHYKVEKVADTNEAF